MARLVVITPVGYGHETLVHRARASVENAIAFSPGEFSTIDHLVIYDQGEGRSATRNSGMIEADWYFFLDADDQMTPNALTLNDFTKDATFGAICLNGKIPMANQYPVEIEEIKTYGSKGTLSMGFFVRAEVARELRFNPNLDIGEDFDFYCRLIKDYSFMKHRLPLVDIDRTTRSAHGPRGYEEIDWQGECNKIIIQYFHCHALLEPPDPPQPIDSNLP